MLKVVIIKWSHYGKCLFSSIFWLFYNEHVLFICNFFSSYIIGIVHLMIKSPSIPVRITIEEILNWMEVTFKAHSTLESYSYNFSRFSTHLKALIHHNIKCRPLYPTDNSTFPKSLPLEYCDEANSTLLENHQK